MTPDPKVIIGWVEERTRRLRLLAADLVESRPAFVQLDLDAIHQHNLQQQLLCQEIQRLDSQIARVATAGTSPGCARALSLEGIVSGWSEKDESTLRALLKEHEAVRKQVCEISRVQADLVRRSRRYLRVLSNLVCNSMGFYEAPHFQGGFPDTVRSMW